jgi:hypothetical protein
VKSENQISKPETNFTGQNPVASSGVSELGDEIYLKAVTPECFYRGSSQSLLEFPLEAYGNDGIGIHHCAASSGELIRSD